MAQVLLLTPPEQAADLAFLLEEEGHEPCFWPVLGAPAELPPGLRAVAEQVHRLTWVVAMGRAPLRAFLEAVNGAGTRASLRKLQWLAADAPTARAIERQGGTVRVPGDGKWTSAVSGLLTGDDEVLVLHAGEAPEILLDSLDAAGVGFTQVAVPATVEAKDFTPVDHRVVIVHSAAAGEAFVELTQGLPASGPAAPQCCGPSAVESPAPPRALRADGLRIVATTPAAAAALESLGVEVYATATASAADAVVDAALRRPDGVGSALACVLFLSWRGSWPCPLSPSRRASFPTRCCSAPSESDRVALVQVLSQRVEETKGATIPLKTYTRVAGGAGPSRHRPLGADHRAARRHPRPPDDGGARRREVPRRRDRGASSCRCRLAVERCHLVAMGAGKLDVDGSKVFVQDLFTGKWARRTLASIARARARAPVSGEAPAVKR